MRICHVVRVIQHDDANGGVDRSRHMFFFRDEDMADAVILRRTLRQHYNKFWVVPPSVELTSECAIEDETRFVCNGQEFPLEDMLSKMKNTRDAMKEPDNDMMIRLGEAHVGILRRLFRRLFCCCDSLDVPPGRIENQCSYE